MTKRLVAIGTFVGAIVLSIFAFKTVGHMPVIYTTVSPDKTYAVLLRGKEFRPRLPIVEHSVYFDLYRNGEQVARGQELHSGDWFDPAFENYYPGYSWENSSTLMFHRRKGDEGPFDTLNITNNTSKSIKFLRVQAIDMFLLFDLKPQARVSLSASPQTWASWVTAKGEFEDGTSIRYNAKNFEIDTRQRGPFTYEITINEDGPVISNGFPQEAESNLDRVSTGSGSDLVSDQHAIFPNDFDSYSLTRSLPLPVLTRFQVRL